MRMAAENSIKDFISHDALLMQLFFSGALSEEEQLEFLTKQNKNIRELEKRLIDNYDKNLSEFTGTTGLNENDRRLSSAVFAHRWGLIKCREYAKLIKEIKAEITAK